MQPTNVIVRPTPEAPRPGLWVDAFAAPGGDGSSEKPFKALPASLPPRAIVHLRSGVYAGPFTFEDVRVEGHGEVVLTSEAGQTTVTAGEDTELEALSIQGGDVGLFVPAGVKTSTGAKLHFSGQRKLAARIEGAWALSDGELVASVEGVDGVSTLGALTLRDVKLEGGFRRGVSCERGTLDLKRLASRGVKVAVHAVDCTSTVSGGRFEAGAGAALFIAGGSLELASLEVRGAEYGLQLTRHAKVKARELDVARAQQQCISVLQSDLTLTTAQLTACSGGGVLVQDGTATLSGLVVHDTPDVGVLARQSTVSVTDSTFTRITSSDGQSLGDAIHARQAKVTLERVRASDLDGSGLYASASAEVEVRSLEVERAKQPALFVERHSTVRVKTLLVRGGNGAVLVPDQARVKLESLSVAGGRELPIYAECNEGAEVELGRIESTVQQLPSRCITPLTP